jgi:SAM-dependent methyltransferase
LDEINNVARSTIFNWDIDSFDDLLTSCKWDPLTPYILKYFSEPGPILEAGCGAARYVKFLHDRGFNCIGLEYNQETIRNVLAKWPNLKIEQGDVAQMPYADNTFAAILSIGVIEHFNEGPHRVLKEMYRVLAPAGVALISVPCLNWLRRSKGPFCGISYILRAHPWIRRLFNKQPYHSYKWNLLEKQYKYHAYPEWGDFHEYRFTPKQFEAFLIAANFRLLESEPIDHLSGMYHEFRGTMATYKHCKIHLYPHAKILNNLFSKIRFFHNHMHLCVVTKPDFEKPTSA